VPKWLRRAERDLDEVEAYIAQDNPRAAVETVLTIIAAADQLDEFPALGRPGRVAGTRELVVEGLPYIVPYRMRGGVIEILRVYHAARRWPARISARG
jgi:toxin ParE1/3/4